MRFTYTGYIQLIQDFTQDTDTADAVYARYLNEGAGILYGVLNTHVNRDTKTITTVADTDTYYLPVSMNRVVSATVTIGSDKYPIWPVEDQRMWDLMKSNSSTSDQPTHFLADSRKIVLYPTPSAAKTVTLIGEVSPPVLGIADYTTGTVTLTNGDATVTGAGTTFTSQMVNRYLQVTPTNAGDGFWYKIGTFTSTTALELVQDYEGSTISGKSYIIGEMYDLPEDLQVAPAHYAAMRFFQGDRRSQKKYIEHKGEWRELLAHAKSRYGTRTVYPISSSRIARYRGVDPNSYPTITT